MMGDMVTHKNIRISGKVQGVGFRYATRQAAFVSGIKGFVRNLPDGDVYIEAEGPADNMEQFIAWCRQGPQRAIIKHVDIYGGDNSGFQDFVIR